MNKVPIGRYIAFVGSVLLAMLVIVDWLLPMGPTQSVTGGEGDKSIIRIKSDHKWPERIVFDTSAPTIVPQMPPVVADAPVTNPPREAYAMLGAPVPEVLGTSLQHASGSDLACFRPMNILAALPNGTSHQIGNDGWRSFIQFG